LGKKSNPCEADLLIFSSRLADFARFPFLLVQKWYNCTGQKTAKKQGERAIYISFIFIINFFVKVPLIKIKKKTVQPYSNFCTIFKYLIIKSLHSP
jgi:hypothetical protein